MSDDVQPDEEEFETWLAGRPANIQAAARQWPPGARIVIEDVTFHVLGWAETTEKHVALILSPIDPVTDYEGARANCIYVCAYHLTVSPTQH